MPVNGNTNQQILVQALGGGPAYPATQSLQGQAGYPSAGPLKGATIPYWSYGAGKPTFTAPYGSLYTDTNAISQGTNGYYIFLPSSAGIGTWQNIQNALSSFIRTLNGETGDVTIVGGSNVVVSPAGQNITIGVTGVVTAVNVTAPITNTGTATVPNIGLTNPLPIANGGTGSTTQNFVDLTTAQTAGGVKTWNSQGVFVGGLTATSNIDAHHPGQVAPVFGDSGDIGALRSAGVGYVALGTTASQGGQFGYDQGGGGYNFYGNGVTAPSLFGQIKSTGFVAASSIYGPTSATVNGPIYADGASGGIAAGFHGGNGANSLLLQGHAPIGTGLAIIADAFNQTTATGKTTFAVTRNNLATNLFSVSDGGAGSFAGGLSVTGSGSFAGGLSVTGAGTLLLGGAANSLAGNPGGFLQVGSTAGGNVIYDYAGIQARSNGAASTLSINALGGATSFGGTVTIHGVSNLQVSALGATSSPVNANAGDGIFQRSASTGQIFLGGATANVGLDFGITTAGVATFSTPVAATTFTGTGTGATYPFLFPSAASSGFTGIEGSGGNTVAGVRDSLFGVDNKNVLALVAVDTSGNMGIAGSYSSVSKRALKEHVQPLRFDPLQVVRDTEILRWAYKQQEIADPEQAANIGPMADDAPEHLVDPEREGVNINNAIWILYAAVKQLAERVDALA